MRRIRRRATLPGLAAVMGLLAAAGACTLSAPRGGESVGEPPDLTPRDAFRLDSVVTP